MFRLAALWARRSAASFSSNPATWRLSTHSAVPNKTLESVVGSRNRFSPYLLFVPSSICAYLAYWQYERKQWKEELLEQRKQVLAGPAVDIFVLKAPGTDQRVAVAGTFLHQRSQYVGPRPKSVNGAVQLGYFVITPLLSVDGRSVVLVNRGWVPQSWRDNAQHIAQDGSAAQPGAATASLPKEVAAVTGVIQPDEQPTVFMPNNEATKGVFYSIKRKELASACGVPLDTLLVQVVCSDPAASPPVESGGHGMSGGARSLGRGANAPPAAASTFPLEKHRDELLRFPVMPQDHLGYAATWTLLSVGLAGFAWHVIKAKPTGLSRFVDNRAAWSGRQGGDGA